jgi:glycerol-3-phosphate dehydrogenase
MAQILGWDDTTEAREIEHYEARVRAERESQVQPDDQTADAARVGAPDVRRNGEGADRAPVVSLDERRGND